MPKKDIVDDCHLLIQQFVVYVYLRKFDFNDLHELRYQMFVNSSSNDFRTLPPPKDALFQHLLRASEMGMGEFIVAGSSSSEGVMGLEDLRGELKFNWKTIDCYDKLVKLAAVCQCMCNKCLNCKCAKTNIKCLRFCNCVQKCQNI